MLITLQSIQASSSQPGRARVRIDERNTVPLGDLTGRHGRPARIAAKEPDALLNLDESVRVILGKLGLALGIGKHNFQLCAVMPRYYLPLCYGKFCGERCLI